ncbi:ribonuclease Y [Pelagicoccus sp. SDUM812003]|uniref:ribonuclease Y n=1 Tax=Pelagicoccus sp. SDUM812003 TaxID=3041267 RepID=UPI00280E972C|nr:ribonuclease Y [Pelagicoccus sp. SDUM812003]MDQ8201621.1 ribonuclease Y [Pelagicoccus sp. SDUM812003]
MSPFFFMGNDIWIAIASLLIGATAGYVILLLSMRRARRRAKEEADALLDISRRKAEIEALEARAKVEREIEGLRSDFERAEQRSELEIEMKLKEIRSHEESLGSLDHQLQLRQRQIEKELEEVQSSRRNLSEMTANLQRTMANLASMDVAEIKKALQEQVEMDCSEELKKLRREIMERSEAEINREAKRTVLAAMQRIASKPNNDITAAVVQLPNDEMKGRIIGREGRNIKCFETATGTTLLIDESPSIVMVSSFDPVRREIAKVALERLVSDGRIHPATIEEFVGEARNDVDQIVEDAGDAAVQQLKISRLHPEIITLLGKLKFRTSYSQNVLEHSVEVGFLASIIASELGLDPNIAKRAGLLHDIGKAIDGEYEGSHAIVGSEFVQARGEHGIVVNAVAAHHEEVPPESLYAGVVILADTISAVRPGARAESMTAYIDRLKVLEKVAKSFPGVSTAYAIQAGREVRVIVDPDRADDEQARDLSRRIRDEIQEKLDFPSSIRVTVVREQRFVETAK